MAKPGGTVMRSIVSTSLNYRFLVVAVGTLLMALGIAILPSTRVDAFPSSRLRESSSRPPALASRLRTWNSWSPCRWSRR